MSGGDSNSGGMPGGMLPQQNIPAFVATEGVDQFIPNPPQMTFPTSIPGFMDSTASQLAGAFGGSENDIMDMLANLYQPMTTNFLQYPISVYAGQQSGEGLSYESGNPVLDLLLEGKGRVAGRPYKKDQPYGGAFGSGR